MNKYIFSIDFGSSNIKTIVMKIINEDIEVFDKFIVINNGIKSFENYIIDYISKKQIKNEEIEIFLLCGGGSSYYQKKFIDYNAIKIDEIKAIGFGAVVLSKKQKVMAVNLGTGTTIVYSDFNETIHLSGTGLGGGTFIGLCKKLNIDYKNIAELFEMADIGNASNVDLIISDISSEQISDMSKDVTCSNFGGINKKCTNSDIVSSVLNLISQNIGLIVSAVYDSLTKEKEDVDIVLSGTFISHKVVKKYFSFIEKYTKKNYIYIDDEYSPYTTAIGAYEYYLIMIRENVNI